ncbi:MAG: sugar phosphate isomerase/epimerase [Kiritimatiellae bacterium]|nr:sugar phosphate isomerase/epimerase [Kiritimatiellia bacterium]
MRPKIIMHINFCEQGQSIPETCAKAARWGYDGIEFRGYSEQHGATPEQYLDSIAQATQQFGLKEVLFSANPNCTNPSHAAREQDIAGVLSFLRLAHERFDFSICNAFSGSLHNPDKSVPYTDFAQHGSAIATADQWQWHVQAFRQIGDLAQSLGFRVAFETHPNYLHDWPAVTRKLVDQIAHPCVGINLDYANYYAMTDKPDMEDVLNCVGDWLYYVHLKNIIRIPGPHELRVGLGEGDVNNRELLRKLKQRGYSGFLTIEGPRPGDREWFAQTDIKYLLALLSDLNWL